MSKFKILAVVLSSVLLLCLSAACSKKAPRVNGGDIIKRSAGKTAALKSYHFSFRSGAGTAKRVKTIRINGDWQAPDALRFTLAGGVDHREMLIFDGRTYIRDKANGGWRVTKGRAETAPIKKTIKALTDFKSVKVLKSTKIKGRSVYHLRAVYQASKFIRGPVPGSLGGAAAIVDLWIEKKSYYLNRLRIAINEGSKGNSALKIITRADFSRFNQVQVPEPQ